MGEIPRINVRMLMANSLRELVEYNSLDKITIQDIVDNCGVARQTFYNHFKDKRGLINWIFKTNSDEVIRTYIGKESWDRVLGKVLDRMRENAAIYSNAVNVRGRDCISKYLYSYSRNVYIELVKERFGKDQMTDRLIYSIDFNSHGSASMTKDWFEKGLRESPEHVAERMYCGMPPDLRKFF